MNRCCNGGTLVDGKTPFPDDFGDYWAHPVFDLVGCNRLYCGRCFEYVRSATGIGFARPNMDVDLGALYDRADLTTAPELAATYADRRLYLCRCSRWLEAFTRPVRAEDPDPLTDPAMPWDCVGHPTPAFPAEVDGVYIGRAADVGPLARRALEGFSGPDARPRDAAAWTARLYARVRPTEAADLVAAAAAERLSDADAAVRARAIQFFTIFPLPVGMHRILEALEGDRGGFDDALWGAALQLLGTSERVRELARADVLAGRGRVLYAEMMAQDGPWVLEHATDILRADPAGAGDLLDAAWKHHADPRAVVRRIAPEVSPEVLAAFADRQRLDRRDRAFVLA